MDRKSIMCFRLYLLLLFSFNLFTAGPLFSQTDDCIDKIYYLYDNDGMLYKSIYYSMGDMTGYDIYEYEQNKRVKTTAYVVLASTEEVQLYYTTIYSYSGGNLVQERTVNSGDKLISVRNYEYTNDIPMRETFIYLDGDTTVYKNHYNNGKLVKAESSPGNYTIYEYDTNERLIKTAYYRADTLSDYNTYRYDSLGRESIVQNIKMLNGKEVLTYREEHNYSADNKLEYTCRINYSESELENTDK